MDNDITIDGYYCERQDEDDRFFISSNGKIFSLNEHHVLKEISSLPDGAKRIETKDGQTWDPEYPSTEFYRRVSFIGSEFGDDIKLLLDNGHFVDCGMDYDSGSETSWRVLVFFTPDRVAKYKLHCADPTKLDELRVEYL